MGEVEYLRQNIGDTERMLRFAAAGGLLVAPLLLRWPRWAVALTAAVAGTQLVEATTRY